MSETTLRDEIIEMAQQVILETLLRIRNNPTGQDVEVWRWWIALATNLYEVFRYKTDEIRN